MPHGVVPVPARPKDGKLPIYPPGPGGDEWQRRRYFFLVIWNTLSLRYDKSCKQSIHFWLSEV